MSTLTGVARLARFTARRDRLRLVLWVLGLSLAAVASAASLRGVYDTPAAIASYVRLFGDNPALVAFAGPGYGFDDPSLGVILVNEVQLWGAIAMAVMSSFLVTRATRAEEDHERAELVRAAVVGRHAPTAAAIAVITAAEVAVGAITAAGFVALGYPATGSVALAASMVVVGLVFIGVTTLCAQLAASSRGTLGLAALLLTVAFVVRAVGDIGHNVLTWCSPIGWAQGVRAFADERWWTLVVCVAASVVLVAGAFVVGSRRDLGSGVFATRPGRVAAARSLRRPLGLALRLERGSLLAWAGGLGLAGAVYGSIADDVEQMLVDNPQLADYLARLTGASITDAYLGAAATMLAVLACGWAVSSMLAAHAEEVAGRAELMLSTPLERWRWLGAHLVVAAGGSVVVLVAAGVGLGAGAAVVIGDVSLVANEVVALLTRLPAVWVVASATALAVAGIPRQALLAWVLVVVVAVVGFLGDALDLPGWARGLSPFHHLNEVPAEPVSWLALVVVTMVALAFSAVAIGLVRRRDIGTA